MRSASSSAAWKHHACQAGRLRPGDACRVALRAGRTPPGRGIVVAGDAHMARPSEQLHREVPSGKPRTSGAAHEQETPPVPSRAHSVAEEHIGGALGTAGTPAEILGFVRSAEAAASLRADHEALDEVAERVLAIIAEGDREDVGAAITELQVRITAHLDGEERDLLPEYARHDPQDAATLLAEHAAIRETLAELDIESDLHLVRLEAMREILRKLRAHAQRENDGLYRWAAHHEDGS